MNYFKGGIKAVGVQDFGPNSVVYGKKQAALPGFDRQG